MSITVEKKNETISAYRRDDKDTGSPEVQVAVLTERIKELTVHLKAPQGGPLVTTWFAQDGLDAQPPAAVPA